MLFFEPPPCFVTQICFPLSPQQPLPSPPTAPPTHWKLPAIPPSPSISLKHLWQLMFKSGAGLSAPCYDGRETRPVTQSRCVTCARSDTCTLSDSNTCYQNIYIYIWKWEGDKERQTEMIWICSKKISNQWEKGARGFEGNMFIFQTFNKISVIINISRGRTPGQAISAVFVFVTFSERCKKKKKKKEKKTTTKKTF